MCKFILFDGRAKDGDTDDASVLDTAEDEHEARQSGREDWEGHDAIWLDVATGNLRWDLPPCKQA